METRGLKFSIEIEIFDRDWKFRAGIDQGRANHEVHIVN